MTQPGRSSLQLRFRRRSFPLRWGAPGAVIGTLLLGLGTPEARAVWSERSTGVPGAAPHVSERPGTGLLRETWSQGSSPRAFTAPLTADGRVGPISLIGTAGQDLRTVVRSDGTVVADAMRQALLSGGNAVGLMDVRRISAAGTLGPVAAVDPDGPNDSNQVFTRPVSALEPNGSVAFAWQMNPGSSSSRISGHIIATRVSASGAVGPRLQLHTNTSEVGSAHIAPDLDGSSWVGWRRGSQVSVRRIAPDNTLGNRLTISDGGNPPVRSSAVVGSDRVLTVLWQVDNRVRLRRVVNGTPSGTVRSLAAPNGSSVLAAALDDGRLALTWTEGGVVKLVIVAAGGNLGSVATVATGTTGIPLIWQLGDGRRLLSWTRAGTREVTPISGQGVTGTVEQVSATVDPGVSSRPFSAHGSEIAFGFTAPAVGPSIAVRDQIAPTITAVDVPATATAGNPVAVSVTAGDSHSGVTDVRWDLGDGLVSDERAPTVTYEAGGTYDVKVTVTDRAGNTAQQTRRIEVAGLPPQRPGVPAALEASVADLTAGRTPAAEIAAVSTGRPVTLAAATGDRAVVHVTGGALRVTRIGPAGGPAGSAVILDSGAPAAFSADISDVDGAVTVAWGDASAASVVRVTAGGTVGTVRRIPGTNASNARVAIAANGVAIVAWGQGNETPVQAVRIAADGTPGPVRQAPDSFTFFDVAAGPDGTGLIVSRLRPAGGAQGLRVHRLAADGTINNGTTLRTTLANTSRFPVEASIAVSAEGAIFVAYRGGTELEGDGGLLRIAVDGAVLPEVKVSPENEIAAGVSLAVSPAGRAIAAWRDRFGGVRTVLARQDRTTRQAYAAVGTRTGTPTSFPVLAGLPDGTFRGAWMLGTVPHVAKPTELDSLPTDAAVLAPSAQAVPAIAGGPAGELLATWNDGSGRLLTSVVDTTPPATTTLSIPREATAGQPVTFSVGLAPDATGSTATWRFPDATTQTGATVTDTFATAGEAVVELDVRDGAGNVIRFRRGIRVLPIDEPAPAAAPQG